MYQTIVVNEMLFKPTSEGINSDIFGLNFMSIKFSPNVYVIRTNEDVISEFVKFKHENIFYHLDNVQVYKNNDMIYLECRSWKEELEESNSL
jgi:hypothetical protein